MLRYLIEQFQVENSILWSAQLFKQPKELREKNVNFMRGGGKHDFGQKIYTPDLVRIQEEGQF